MLPMLRRVANQIPSGLVLLFMFTPFWVSPFFSAAYPPPLESQVAARVSAGVAVVACGVGIFQPPLMRLSLVMLVLWTAVCIGRLAC
jgi:hypothetical protein